MGGKKRIRLPHLLYLNSLYEYSYYKKRDILANRMIYGVTKICTNTCRFAYYCFYRHIQTSFLRYAAFYKCFCAVRSNYDFQHNGMRFQIFSLFTFNFITILIIFRLFADAFFLFSFHDYCVVLTTTQIQISH